MRKLQLLIICNLIFLGAGFTAHAQPGSKRVSIELQGAPIDSLIMELESQTGYHFYYDPTQFDSLRVSVSVTNVSLTKVLELVFANSEYHFAIPEKQAYVLLTKGATIKTTLPPGFFSAPAMDSLQATTPYYGDKKKTRVDASIENKLFEIGVRNNNQGPPSVAMAGYVRNIKSGEPVVGAVITLTNPSLSVATDQYGYYSITLPKGRNIISIQGIGMKDTRRQIMVYSTGNFNIDMDERVTSLKEVIVSAQKLANVRNVQMGIDHLSIKAIKQVPTAFGEADIIKAVTMLPGVKTVGEASTGFNVRGGSADQNLILFNDATIYNPSHFFGFFSAFNPEVVKEVELYKSSIPAKYGGRLSSVLDISSREGNKKEFAGVAGVGLLTSRITLEGPIKKDKTSFILGARTTYANWLLQFLPDQYKHSKASFYDLNLNISHQFNKNNNLYITGYTSSDRFNLNSDTTYGYSNKNASIKWKHIFNNKLTMVITGGYDHYDYHIGSDKDSLFAYKMKFDINQYNFKTDFNWYVHPNHTIDFGISSIRYLLHPGTYEPNNKSSLVARDNMEAEHAQESAAYLSEKWNITDALSLQAGLRYSIFNFLGPKTVNEYAPDLPITDDNLVQQETYAKNKIIHTYQGPEYRLAIRYSLTSSFSVKAGYNSLRQYIHMLSNTTAISPTDIWKLSDPNIKPQLGDQVSFGLYKNFKSNTIEASAEGYYKNIKNYLDYKSGAQLVLNHHIETDVIGTKGKAYGVELMVKKQNGKLNGWISYTWSRILLKMDDSTKGELINDGKFYPASYDKPNDITMVGNYRFSHRFSVSMNMTYSTGRPITLPIGRFFYANSWRALYADRNAYRIPDYFRTDLSMNIEGNHKIHQKTHNSWTIGVYNLTARRNPYSVYYVSENGAINGYKLSIFGNAIPFVNFNIRF
ncbi:TonB-dependent receptor [Niastella koreensis]|uniref:TonB-dependent receptor plug n=2 Tax=Niastella koreensis TaxID=354356 RepID=G8TLE4_NIAKG|nr:carboxypeptidase-like regulatory domain-containing protein [Niastella koreensis]AEW03017.1 TonB-dependent receptor plug [Niastella koreensis GR20-10]OQP55331.1 TonB-dependent receptor [Niastella koreensis]